MNLRFVGLFLSKLIRLFGKLWKYLLKTVFFVAWFWKQRFFRFYWNMKFLLSWLNFWDFICKILFVNLKLLLQIKWPSMTLYLTSEISHNFQQVVFEAPKSMKMFENFHFYSVDISDFRIFLSPRFYLNSTLRIESSFKVISRKNLSAGKILIFPHCDEIAIFESQTKVTFLTSSGGKYVKTQFLPEFLLLRDFTSHFGLLPTKASHNSLWKYFRLRPFHFTKKTYFFHDENNLDLELRPSRPKGLMKVEIYFIELWWKNDFT